MLDPYAAYLESTQVVVGVDFDEQTGLPKKSMYLAPNHVTRLEPLDEPVPTETSNGRS